MTTTDRLASPHIMYVCQCCWQHDGEFYGYTDPTELRLLPDGTQICRDCFEDRHHCELYDELPPWESLPAAPTMRAAWFLRLLSLFRWRRREPTTFQRCLAVHIHFAAPRSALR